MLSIIGAFWQTIEGGWAFVAPVIKITIDFRQKKPKICLLLCVLRKIDLGGWAFVAPMIKTTFDYRQKKSKICMLLLARFEKNRLWVNHLWHLRSKSHLVMVQKSRKYACYYRRVLGKNRLLWECSNQNWLSAKKDEKMPQIIGKKSPKYDGCYRCHFRKKSKNTLLGECSNYTWLSAKKDEKMPQLIIGKKSQKNA